MLLPKRIWKDIKDYEGIYQVSNDGKVKSLERINSNNCWVKEKILKQTIDPKGYQRVMLSKNGKKENARVHRLVAEEFIPNPNNYPQINHKDENKTNNHVSNLEWCNEKYNINYGTGKERRSRKVICITTGKVYNSIKEATEFHNISDKSGITKACQGKRNTCYGLKWMYYDEYLQNTK